MPLSPLPSQSSDLPRLYSQQQSKNVMPPSIGAMHDLNSGLFFGRCAEMVATQTERGHFDAGLAELP